MDPSIVRGLHPTITLPAIQVPPNARLPVEIEKKRTLVLESTEQDQKTTREIMGEAGELKGAVEMTPTRIIGPPTTFINEAIFLPYHPSNEGKRLKPAVLGVKAKPVDRPARYERVKDSRLTSMVQFFQDLFPTAPMAEI
ncbi:hypothetical protein AVEN_170487-1 [Araneus ventricosus]|uniref:Uncharacterized protein n=1 Tax=Araneus ventricosus TaxID=182803 RepID=A0A4Y2C1Z5_ARAVE|nr:hypothetical protein AVEN_170487-1 [Araneus ventricosus]